MIHPQRGDGLTSGRGALLTSYGRIVGDWTIVGNVFTLSVTVPVNTTANVVVAFANDVRRDGLTAAAGPDGSYALPSGTYVFTADAP